MRIQIVSDVHLEFWSDQGQSFVDKLPIEGDVLVIAGDFALTHILFLRLNEVCKAWAPRPVLFVCGNHEFYMSDRGSVHNILVKVGKRNDNFHWLRESSIVIEGQRFVGTTMWFPNHPLNFRYQHRMNDWKCIRGFKNWVYDANTKAKLYLQRTLEPDDVVITHHLPSWQSVDPAHKGDDINRFYVCDWAEKFIRLIGPKLWIHGHGHISLDYMAGDTRVVANPYGYDGYDTNMDFNWNMVVDLEGMNELLRQAVKASEKPLEDDWAEKLATDLVEAGEAEYGAPTAGSGKSEGH